MSEPVVIDGCTLYTGDVMAVLPTLAPESVHCVVTSPPYFALRSYLPKDHADKGKEIGSEPTPEAFIKTMVDVFREVRRVLRDDGVLWVNLGDSYIGSSGAGTRCDQTNTGGADAEFSAVRPPSMRPGKDTVSGQLLNIPHRVAEALRQDGWIWRQTVVWSKRSPMPESVGGWRWVRCRVKVGGGWGGDRPHPSHDMEQSKSGVSFSQGRQNTIPAVTWQDCPGCPKCEKTGGYVLRRGSGRCTTAHEYIFLFAKTNRYFWDGEASKEAALMTCTSRTNGGKSESAVAGEVRANSTFERSNVNISHRNPRSVWTLSSEPTSVRHFATFPSELVRRCLASSPATGGVCAACGAPYAPVVESERVATRPGENTKIKIPGGWDIEAGTHTNENRQGRTPTTYTDRAEIGNRDPERHVTTSKVSGYRPTCACGAGKCGPTILDPFSGIGTVQQTARQLGCRSIYIDLNPAYVEIAKTRILEPPRWWLRQRAKEGRPVTVNREPFTLFAETETP